MHIILYHHHQWNFCMGYIGRIIELLKSPRPVLTDICTRTYLFSEKRLKDILTSSLFEMKCLICENTVKKIKQYCWIISIISIFP